MSSLRLLEVTGDIMRAGIRVNCVDRIIRKIHEERECQELVQQVNTLRVQLKNLLRQAEQNQAKKNLDPPPANLSLKFSIALAP